MKLNTSLTKWFKKEPSRWWICNMKVHCIRKCNLVRFFCCHLIDIKVLVSLASLNVEKCRSPPISSHPFSAFFPSHTAKYPLPANESCGTLLYGKHLFAQLLFMSSQQLLMAFGRFYNHFFIIFELKLWPIWVILSHI